MEKNQTQIQIDELKKAKKMPWKKVLLGFIAIVLLVVLFSVFNSSNSTEYETELLEIRTLQTVISEVGSVKPKDQLSLSFTSGGTLAQIHVQEGAKVAKGTILAEVDKVELEKQKIQQQAAVETAEANLEKVTSGLTIEDKAILTTTVENAEKLVTQLKKNLAATQARGEQEIKEAKVSLDNAYEIFQKTQDSNLVSDNADLRLAESQVKNAESTLEQVMKVNEENVKNARAAVEQAQVSYDNALKGLSINAPIQDKNILDAQEDAFYDAVEHLDGVDNSLREINTIITVEEYNKDQNATYRNVLGVKKTNSYNNTETKYFELRELFDSNRDLFVVTNRSISYTEIIGRLQILKTLLDKSYDALTTTYTMLENSLTSSTLSEVQLNTFRTNILSQREKISNSLAAIANTIQSVENLQLQKGSQVTSLESAVSTAEASLNAAKQSLNNTIAQAESQETTARNTLTSAKDSFEKAKANVSRLDIEVLQAENAYMQAKQTLESTKARVLEQNSNAERQLLDAESQLKNAQKQRDAGVAPARAEDLKIAQSQLEEAKARLGIVEKQLQNASIVAPIDGVVTDVIPDIGEYVSPSMVAISMISEAVDTIEVNVSETEIAEVKEGQDVLFDFDAFDLEDKYHGKVSFIYPDKTSLDGVIYYRTEIEFNANEYKGNTVRPGMTANMDIITERRVGVPSLSKQVVKIDREEGGYYVDILVGNSREKREVFTGFEGDDYIEIMGGLSDEDQVIISVKEKGDGS